MPKGCHVFDMPKQAMFEILIVKQQSTVGHNSAQWVSNMVYTQ